MYDEQQICPYTGLRSFTEEESLYFKGREEDIDQATLQLQRNKFLMLTGASGDGKSSLVYAGIIPNARAGFLKAKNTNWRVADFRPERDPFGNLCKVIARELGVANLSTVEAELGHGFSALVDLYRNSPLYLDQDGSEWRNADDRRKAAMKREAANLLILVDQFEEFFTNPENYRHGAPSKESNMVLNILLETARISLEEDLPIYVVFTMRSDYIGQCAAFRGLPENIGFSQFFVPRLNRSQLQQVIEEPATLSGNRITRRLTERLIHDITEGVDQLPILQHALNQIWVAADSGKEEMDLIHYAMVGGMPVDELPDDQVSRFKEWFAGLPAYIQACYHKPGLHNVLDTHTNKLYEQAGGYYREHTGKALSDDDAKRIIRSAFTCLTKIDQGRAVRNRMTLEEITNIIGDPAIGVGTVGEVLNIFREPGNTFIHPFILHEDEDTRQLPAGQVLDITHESLIRNWQYLGQWAKEEFDSRSVSLDLDVQLDRWVTNGKSKDYLMSIGQLTYFEAWFNKTRPNAWWMARYLPGDAGTEAKLGKARVLLDDTKEFLAKSASKHAFTRTIMRYGTKRIAAVAAVLVALGLTSFAVADYMKKRNAAVISDIQKDATRLLNDEKVDLGTKAFYVTESMKLGLLDINGSISSVSDSVNRLDVANGIAQMLLFQGQGDAAAEVDSSLTIADSLLSGFTIPWKDPVRLEAILRQINNMGSTLALGNFYIPGKTMAGHGAFVARKAADWALAIAEKQPAGVTNMQEFNLAIENGLNGGVFTPEERRKLLAILSPFENTQRSTWLQENYKLDKLMDRGEQGYGFLFNGLYQELAYLYAAEGNTDQALRCVDTLLQYSQRNFLGDYASGADNAINIAVTFYRNGQTAHLDDFVQGYCARKKFDESEFYRMLIAHGLHERATAAGLNLLWWMGYRMNFNSRYVSRDQLNFFFDKYRSRLKATVKNADEFSYRFALSYKDQGIHTARLHDANGPGGTAYFDTAINLFRTLSPAYLSGTLMARLSTVDETPTSRRSLFIYPDVRPEFNPFEPRSFVFYHFSDAFLDYILDHGLTREFYSTAQDRKELEAWFEAVNVTEFTASSFLVKGPSRRTLQKLDSSLNGELAQGTDLNMLRLMLGRAAQKDGDTAAMLRAYDKLIPVNFPNILRTAEFASNPKHHALSLIGYAMKGYMETGHDQRAIALVRGFKSPINRASLYAYVAMELTLQHADDKLIDRMIDSSRVETGRTEQVGTDQPNRQSLATALAFRDRSRHAGEIDRLIKNLPNKSQALAALSRADGFQQKLYEGTREIPDLLSNNARLNQYGYLIHGYGESGLPIRKGWDYFNDNYLFLWMHRIEYVDESH